MTSEKNGHDLIAELLITHATPITLFVAGRQQHRQQVTLINTTGTALLDDAVDHCIKEFVSLFRLPIARQWEFLNQIIKGQQEAGEQLENGGQGCANVL